MSEHKDITKHYTNGEITITWKPNQCIHSKLCWTGLAEVFNPRERPWIKMDAATTASIMAQVDKCPSGALSYFRNEEKIENKNPEVDVDTIVEVAANGPLLVYGNITIKNKNGEEVKKNKVTALCRCGASGNKPYCDGTHVKIGFKDE
ncbi:MAG: (4Fe-4S)-binding protein [Chitinophagales bacterium]|nr:(4Fe-4S)-binding protein [Chitinophagales bacterium]